MPATVEITHPDRVLFPADGITKGDLVELLLGGRRRDCAASEGPPAHVWRFPRGIDEKGFVQQDFADSLPDWMGRVKVAKEDGTLVHPTADVRDALRWLANQNCVIVHAWLSRRDRLHTRTGLFSTSTPPISDFAVVQGDCALLADCSTISACLVRADHRLARPFMS